MLASDPNAVDALIARFGMGITEMTALRLPGAKLHDVLSTLHWKHVLEIGTCHGLTAAVLAEHAEHVTTIDIEDRPICEEVWKFFGILGKIDRRVVKDDAHKDAIVRGLDFDCAYVDGCHSRAGAIFDFAITRRCKTVLFHDYPSADMEPPGGWHYYDRPVDYSGDGVGYLLDCIVPAGRIVRVAPFAWWFQA